jgi:hypothetical protein
MHVVVSAAEGGYGAVARARGFAYYHDVPVPSEEFMMHTRALIRNNGTAILV